MEHCTSNLLTKVSGTTAANNDRNLPGTGLCQSIRMKRFFFCSFWLMFRLDWKNGISSPFFVLEAYDWKVLRQHFSLISAPKWSQPLMPFCCCFLVITYLVFRKTGQSPTLIQFLQPKKWILATELCCFHYGLTQSPAATPPHPPPPKNTGPRRGKTILTRGADGSTDRQRFTSVIQDLQTGPFSHSIHLTITCLTPFHGIVGRE